MALNYPQPIRPKLIIPQEQPSRWRWTYSIELQVWSGSNQPASQGPISAANVVVNLPINPSSIRITSPMAHRSSYAAGGMSVDEGGFHEQEIHVSGTTGLAPKRGWSPGTLGSDGRPTGGGMTYSDGNQLWRELRQIFRLYSAMVQEAREGVHARMVWHDWRNEDHWVVVPVSWEMDRSTQHRIHYPYAFTLKAVADDARPEPPLLMQIQDGVAQVVALIGVTTGYLADAAALVRELNVTIQGGALALIGAFRDVVRAADGIKQGIRDTLNIPAVLGGALQAMADDLMLLLGEDLDRSSWAPTSPGASAAHARYETFAALGDMADSLVARRDRWGRSWAEDSARSAEIERGEGRVGRQEIARASSGRRAGDTGLTERALPGTEQRVASARAVRSSASPAVVYRGHRPYVIQAGDTLPGIAHREMGDSEAWVALAGANSLRYPYITRDGIAGTARPGDTIAIPTPSPGAAPRNDGIFGSDIYISPAGEWEIDAGSGDVRRVTGVDALMQGLDLKARTEVGGNAVWPGLGVLAPIGRTNGGIADAVALSVRRVALGDPRVESVGATRVIEEGDAIMVEIDVVPRGASVSRVLRRAAE